MLAHAFIRHVPATPGLAAIGVLLVTAIAWSASPAARPPSEGRAEDTKLTSWSGILSPAQWAGRAVAIALLALAVLAGRTGSSNQLRNIAPALVVGAGWPLLVLASSLFGGVWRWIDPWDALARLLSWRQERVAVSSSAPVQGDVWPAIVPALGWAWYLSAFQNSLSPRAVGTALAVYSIVAVAGSLAFGRVRWLARTELYGLLFGWMARIPSRRLVSWATPAGAAVVLGVVAGGLLFGAVRRSSLWGTLNVVALANLYAAAGVVGASVAVGGMFGLLERWSYRVGAPGTVAAAAVPAVASVILAVAMVRDRLFTSIQLLPILASDPFGRGWNLLGTADSSIVLEPLGDGGRALAQAVTLVAGHVVGAIVLARRAQRSARLPAALGLCALLVSAAVALSLR